MKHTFLKTFGIKITIGGCSAMINLEIIPLKIFGQVLEFDCVLT
jgi:hypothetical protein